MKVRILIIFLIFLVSFSCSKKDENKEQLPKKSETKAEEKADLSGIKISDLHFDGKTLNGIIENRSDKILDSLVLRISFVNDFDSLPMRFNLPVVTGDEDGEVPAGYAKEFKYEFENPTWTDAENIDAKILSGKWKQD
ncbi:MAG: hypothetical protein ACLFSQ_03980 [Candidatus Zixiibacteriota bacterium]